MGKLLNLIDAPRAYKVTYYKNELCQEIKTAVFLGESIKEVAVLAEGVACSEYHILSIEDIGLGYISVEEFVKNIDIVNKIE